MNFFEVIVIAHLLNYLLPFLSLATFTLYIRVCPLHGYLFVNSS